MATPETIGLAVCSGCKRETDVKLNAGGFAYYHCGCGHSERTHNNSSSRQFMKRVKPVNLYGDETEEKPGIPATEKSAVPAPVPENSGKKQEEKKAFKFY